MFRYLFLSIVALLFLGACDNRNSVSRSRPQSTYSLDMVAVKDYSQNRDIIELGFWRDSDPYENALIKVGDLIIPSAGGGIYSGQSPTITLLEGANQFSFADTEKTYSKMLTVNFPDSFGVTNVNPRDNGNGESVLINWSQASGATSYVLSVVARGYPENGTTPFTQLLSSGVFTYIIPDTVFEDISGFVVDDTYLIYLAAFSDGFGEFPGIRFPLPNNLPERRVTDPDGYIRAGIVAPIDSIVVRP